MFKILNTKDIFIFGHLDFGFVWDLVLVPRPLAGIPVALGDLGRI